jgi:hypothetical protein
MGRLVSSFVLLTPNLLFQTFEACLKALSEIEWDGDALDPGVMLFYVYRLEEEVGSMPGRKEPSNSSAIHPSMWNAHIIVNQTV